MPMDEMSQTALPCVILRVVRLQLKLRAGSIMHTIVAYQHGYVCSQIDATIA